jgi:membrane associated rhomboid family serine protease
MVFIPENRRQREPFLSAPPVVLWLIGFLLAMHVLRVVLPGSAPDDVVENYGFIPARYAAAAAQGVSLGQLIELGLSFITYMFLHGDFTHVGINSLWLLVFGPIVARKLGALRFVLFFLVCGIAAAVVHLIVYWGAAMAVVGASGGVSGLMAGGMRIVYGRMLGDAKNLAPIFSKPIMAFSAVWVVVNIVSGVLRLGVTDDLTLIAWVAHLGGYFAGLILIGVFNRHALEQHGLRAA